jgi:hypothetical protein
LAQWAGALIAYCQFTELPADRDDGKKGILDRLLRG